MELHNLEKIWEEANRKIQDNKTLTEKIIMQSIRQKSLDSAERLQGELRIGNNSILAPGVLVDVYCAFRATVVDRRHSHSRNTVHNLVGESLSHEAGSNHTHTNTFSLFFPNLQGLVHDDHIDLTKGPFSD